MRATRAKKMAAADDSARSARRKLRDILAAPLTSTAH
jgi:hypothetical protein